MTIKNNSFDFVMETLSDKDIHKLDTKENELKNGVSKITQHLKDFQKNDKEFRNILKKDEDAAMTKGTAEFAKASLYAQQATRSLENAIKVFDDLKSAFPNNTLSTAAYWSVIVAIISAILIIPLVLTIPIAAGLNVAKKISDSKWNEKYKEYKDLRKGDKKDLISVYNKIEKDLEAAYKDCQIRYGMYLTDFSRN